MLRTNESETEILLGNKQLLGIFFAVAILLGIAFYGGYVVGKGSRTHAPVASTPAPAPETAAAPSNPPTGGETHSVPADSGAVSEPSATDTAPKSPEPPPLGSPKRTATVAAPPEEPFAPHAGQTFLQVTATGRDEAVAIADVLHNKGFRAHAVPKPGSSKLYRVLVGPIHDPADLSSTRDSLRRTGFREVIVQHY
ncbi:MAG TPA: SPOR domain-containing protein [Bryobacteraceae bacterium]|jgi:cell division septation protein DedD|nr:SPOR domain-containing protein [Bryobacteraceae bacterium]